MEPETIMLLISNVFLIGLLIWREYETNRLIESLNNRLMSRDYTEFARMEQTKSKPKIRNPLQRKAAEYEMRFSEQRQDPEEEIER